MTKTGDNAIVISASLDSENLRTLSMTRTAYVNEFPISRTFISQEGQSQTNPLKSFIFAYATKKLPEK